MANYLKMTEASAILTLKEHGWSRRRIARELGIHPDTVGRYVHLSGRDSKPAKAPAGSEGSKPVKTPTGSGEVNACNATSSRSQCDPFHKVIEDKLEEGLSRQRIYQDLTDEYGFEGSYYYSVTIESMSCHSALDAESISLESGFPLSRE